LTDAQSRRRRSLSLTWTRPRAHLGGWRTRKDTWIWPCCASFPVVLLPKWRKWDRVHAHSSDAHCDQRATHSQWKKHSDIRGHCGGEQVEEINEGDTVRNPSISVLLSEPDQRK